MSTIIGKTKSGKDIVNQARHQKHASFTFQDHRDAASLHWGIQDKAMKMLETKREDNPGWKPSQEALNFIQKHRKTMASHVRKANDLDTKGLPSNKFDEMSRREVINRINLMQRMGQGSDARQLYTLLENFEGGK